MHRNSWLLAVEAAKDDDEGAHYHLSSLRNARPDARKHGIDLAGGRRIDVVYADASLAIETARHWIWILGPRPPGAGLLQALRSTRSTADIRQICTATDGDDCAFLLVDKHAGSYAVITDPLNFAPVFHGTIRRSRFLGSDVSLFPRECLTLDVRGVASYILNGNCINNHTAFQEIAWLERASVHEFREGVHERKTYWHYAPGQRSGSRRWDPAAAAAQLWELLVESVDRVTRGKRVLLSLSGGYDSSVLLGILGNRLKHPSVACVTFVHGRQSSRSDAAVAREQAALYGYEHIAAVSFSGDLVRMLDANAVLSQGLRRPAYELEAISRLAEDYGDAADTVMLFGDECLGLYSFRLNSIDDVLGAARFKASALLDDFGRAIGVRQAEWMRAALEAEYDDLRTKARVFADRDDAKDFLYFDQRLQFGLLALRSLFAGHWFPVATPLVSRRIQDFMAQVPVAYRVDKRLFRQMARRFLPEQFRIPRATEGRFHPDFSEEVAAAHDVLTAAIAGRGWKIDGLFTGPMLKNLVGEVRLQAAKRARLGTAKMNLERILIDWFKRLMASSPHLESRQHWWRRHVFNQFAESPGAGYLLVNILCLADFLGDSPSSMFGRTTLARSETNGRLSQEAGSSSFAGKSQTVGSAALSLEAKL
jgi:asparagine synthetase B (glutamine-hydrolysing)